MADEKIKVKCIRKGRGGFAGIQPGETGEVPAWCLDAYPTLIERAEAAPAPAPAPPPAPKPAPKKKRKRARPPEVKPDGDE